MQHEIRVVVDHRELKNEVSKELFEMGIVLSPCAMEAGDFQASERVGIERKSLEDFVASLIDGRMFEQAKRLADTYPRPVLLLEGEGDIYTIRKVHENAIHGAIASLIIDYRIPVFRTKDPKETAKFIAAMAKREQIDLGKENKPRGDKQSFSVKEWQEFIVAGLPGVGGVLGKGLLKRFKSVKGVVNASAEELTEVEKIGKKKAERIKEILEAGYD